MISGGWACNGQKVITIPDDLRQRIVDDIRLHSEAKVADHQVDASITLTNQWGDVLRLGKLDGRPGFSWQDPEATPQESPREWVPSTPELQAEIDALLR